MISSSSLAYKISLSLLGPEVKTSYIVPLFLYGLTLPKQLGEQIELARQNRPGISTLQLHKVNTSDIAAFFKATFENLEKNNIPRLEVDCSTFDLKPAIMRAAIEKALKETKPAQLEAVSFFNNGWTQRDLQGIVKAISLTSIDTIDLSGHCANKEGLQKIVEMIVHQKGAVPVPVRNFIFQPETAPRNVHETGC